MCPARRQTEGHPASPRPLAGQGAPGAGWTGRGCLTPALTLLEVKGDKVNALYPLKNVLCVGIPTVSSA